MFTFFVVPGCRGAIVRVWNLRLGSGTLSGIILLNENVVYQSPLPKDFFQ